ncbi:PP2C family protein-serine/threonine phosphatase [Lachnoanaerobaculum orale]|uniref:PP2C family protein-serine/threonine phosphatase n=1 Tax=Lachnoanaerobaculum orale TaxID=979627 RepID=UPI0023A87A62|nr:serine/threonine protein phosphatase [Lachnoanaerobaculum orale]
MRKQNSKFNTNFISEEGSSLKNSDFFAYAELDNFACYVLADGIEDVADSESAKEAVESIIAKFQEKPSISKGKIHGYLKHANEVLLKAEKYMKLKASIVVAVTDYENVRFGYAGNVRAKLYRNNKMFYKTIDTSLSSEMVSKEMISEDALSRHEQRSNLYTFLGQKGFSPVISGKIKLVDTDILILYTKGVWENVSEGEIDNIFAESGKDPKDALLKVEAVLLDKNLGYIDNYTIAGIYIDKVFIESDTKKKKRRKLILIVSIVSVVVILGAIIALYFYKKYTRELKEDMNTHYEKMLKFIEMENYTKADTECEESIKKAESLRNKEMKDLLYHYEQVIEGIIEADEKYDAKSYKEAKPLYELILSEIPYADNAGLSYVRKRLDFISGYESVNLSLDNGDILFDSEIYDKARERYVDAKTEARDIGYEEGKLKAEAKLLAVDQAIAKKDEGKQAEADKQSQNLKSANDMLSAGDEALSKGDFLSARANYNTAKDILEKSGESAGLSELEQKISTADKKISEGDEEKNKAGGYAVTADEAFLRGDFESARENYEYARRLYVKLKDEINTIEMDKKLSDVQKRIDEKEKEESKAAQSEAQTTQPKTSETQSSSSLSAE